MSEFVYHSVAKVVDSWVSPRYLSQCFDKHVRGEGELGGFPASYVRIWHGDTNLKEPVSHEESIQIRRQIVLATILFVSGFIQITHRKTNGTYTHFMLELCDPRSLEKLLGWMKKQGYAPNYIQI